jgi:hypothetical protein
MRYTLLVAALAASTAVASPALAQQAYPTDTAQANARGVVLQQHSLINNGDLDFGIVTTDGTNSGTVSIAATSSGTRTTGGSGGVVLLPSAFSAARFDGLAAPLETVVLTLNQPVGGVLQDAAGDTITGNLYVDSNGLTRQADANGNFVVWVGGDFGLSATQPSGVYSATFTLTAEYQ